MAYYASLVFAAYFSTSTSNAIDRGGPPPTLRGCVCNKIRPSTRIRVGRAENTIPYTGNNPAVHGRLEDPGNHLFRGCRTSNAGELTMTPPNSCLWTAQSKYFLLCVKFFLHELRPPNFLQSLLHFVKIFPPLNGAPSAEADGIRERLTLACSPSPINLWPKVVPGAYHPPHPSIGGKKEMLKLLSGVRR